ncbi:hypothetical protein C4E24_00965 [ANME-1 cluster archaeon AG-394-G21]|nr:hypothetical protein [ANME-1 cluster archaeon AG-394-G21]
MNPDFFLTPLLALAIIISDISDMNIFGQKLKKLREDKGLTQQQLAEKLGYVTNSYVSDAEKGAFIPSEEKLKKIANALHTPYSTLKELLIETKLESMGITEQAFIGIFKDYPRLTKKDKQAIINAYLKIKEKNEKKE